MMYAAKHYTLHNTMVDHVCYEAMSWSTLFKLSYFDKKYKEEVCLMCMESEFKTDTRLDENIHGN